ncbi:3-hydroxybutyryl-CoA dehydrogenase [Halomonas daqingensis]|uniref:3-hydroxybutyryl-CoA dehydrogenase n=1 Tax=Billgrantia desiderata TaxID=52021 RepID=A0ABS9B7A6_9GAMM|nr:3-hydroxybutyryl-CoA dehydrogenase [Halomonas desiderata]MCE8028708.1 3-hydroxybutyryl-CoA dehydrogenase [Halomonas desiderata]MCE8043518.1 3-hydroxybutyryl-CoA dehydrogenase [Halomonas desiderata]MCE8048092.1 3-hydroxybutyryl-CoA dehydrogenase [Halomonas desiderata]NIC39311.1 3-hydroxybutyryl-CoA dehydrogenase [Halomonas desiderata]OUE38897.1 3-hydroxybutyryl-CoA dehydrogenase [Halomonas desiderata SP1]
MTQQAIGVVGAGTMGQGIAQVLVASGFATRLYDVADEQLGRAQAVIDKGLGKLVAKEKLSEADKAEAMARLETTTSLEALRGCEVIIEAAPEQPALKEKLFRDLSRLSHDAILASNTSSLSLTRLAAVCERPERVVGMHFFNPVPVLKLVEVIRAEQTSDATAARIEELTRQLGKTPVAIADSPGFAVNRLLIPMINEAAFLLQEGAASAEDIDQSMQLGAAHPMGPLALADLIGLDVCLAIMEVLQEGFGDPKYRPCPLLRRMVAAGYLGRKSGRGFHVYQ